MSFSATAIALVGIWVIVKTLQELGVSWPPVVVTIAAIIGFIGAVGVVFGAVSIAFGL